MDDLRLGVPFRVTNLVDLAPDRTPLESESVLGVRAILAIDAICSYSQRFVRACADFFALVSAPKSFLRVGSPPAALRHAFVRHVVVGSIAPRVS